jgi:MoaA/NifB/PqqE/SkfB family radical SAM enzyme
VKTYRDKSLARIFGELLTQPRPEVLNFQVNDICNARCVMCNIWQNKRGKELNPDEFATLLRQPFFQAVKHVGITGGEPTLRGDLPEFYGAILTTLPSLAGASFITNGFKTSEAIAAYGEVNRAYAAAGKQFSGMVSVDGVGEAHDRVRGRVGAFSKATSTLFGLREAGVEVHAACTIVRANIWDLDELLEWGKRNNIYIRFRVGEFIRRLYNLELGDQIRSFDEAETKHLVSFFYKLLLSYEREERIRLTYKSILSVLTGGERLVTCPYQTSRALNVDSAGSFATCAPCGKPTPLGENPARSTVRLLERLRIRRHACPRCVHDYHGELTRRESDRRIQSGLAAGRLTATARPNAPLAISTRTPIHVLIIGWYGTETAGDIAILGGLIEQYCAKGTSRFTVLSLYPAYSRTTLPPLAAELGVQLEVCAYDDPAILNNLSRFDTVSMGGGPLMDIDPTELMRNIFRAARTQGIPCHIDGCGIGPLRQPRFQAVVSEMLELATEVRLRDEASCAAARQLARGLKPEVSPDPSTIYLRRQGIRWQRGPDRVIRCWVRMLTHEYSQPTGLEESTVLLTGLLRRILAWYPDHRLEFGAMHWFPVGWDDREFARELAHRLVDPRVIVDPKPRSPREILHLMAGAQLNLCMRFHSVVFAHNIGAPFVALDYTAGGKIASYLGAAGFAGRELRYTDLVGLDRESFVARQCAPVGGSTP